MLPQFPVPEFDKPHAANLHLLPFPTAVRINKTGVLAVVVGRSTCDGRRFLLVWFDRHYWTICRRWMDRGTFTPLPVTVYPTDEAA